MASKVTRWHFAPTQLSRGNLLAEVCRRRTLPSPAMVIDALHWVLSHIDADTHVGGIDRATSGATFAWQRQHGLITGHRRENFGDGFVQICEALLELTLPLLMCILFTPSI